MAIKKRLKPTPYDNPQHLLVGPFQYAIKDWTDIEAEAAQALGYCDRIRNIIKIKTGLNDQTRAEVLLHEVLHAMFYNSGLTHSDVLTEREEMIVSQFGLGLIALIRTNPNFMPFLIRLLDRNQNDVD